MSPFIDTNAQVVGDVSENLDIFNQGGTGFTCVTLKVARESSHQIIHYKVNTASYIVSAEALDQLFMTASYKLDDHFGSGHLGQVPLCAATYL